jgi:polysaccharide deacetylase family protein (PEP-CTERM system associated)
MTTPVVAAPREGTVTAVRRGEPGTLAEDGRKLDIILSFDVEDHHRIEAAGGLAIDADLASHYRRRLEPATRWVLDQLGERNISATFFILGEIAHRNPRLVRAVHKAGHEVACHGWDHRMLHALSPACFREDLRKSKDALEQASGAPVVGYRAPTFSLVRDTAWAIDVLVEAGMQYDSSIYPVRHDRYGVPAAPRAPFWAQGISHGILELPPLTYRFLGMNLPVGGGGYFRLFPLWLLRRGLAQARRRGTPAAMLYFHPWEFEPDQPRLPLPWTARLRTYAGIRRTRGRLRSLVESVGFTRAIDVARGLTHHQLGLSSFGVGRAE